MTPNIADIIRQHVLLEVRCIDRVYLHGYMPKLQTSGGLCYFLHDYTLWQFDRTTDYYSSVFRDTEPRTRVVSKRPARLLDHDRRSA